MPTKTKETKQTPEAQTEAKEILLNGDFFNHRAGLQAVGDLEANSSAEGRFLYAVQRNLDKLKSPIRAVEKLMGLSSEGYQKFENARYRLALECGAQEVRTPDGGVVATKPTDNEKYSKGLVKLNKEYEADIVAEESRLYAANQTLMQEASEEIDWHKTAYGNIPKSVTANQRSAISFMLEEPTQADWDLLEEQFAEEAEVAAEE